LAFPRAFLPPEAESGHQAWNYRTRVREPFAFPGTFPFERDSP
jgi:hypothetical protein